MLAHRHPPGLASITHLWASEIVHQPFYQPISVSHKINILGVIKCTFRSMIFANDIQVPFEWCIFADKSKLN